MQSSRCIAPKRSPKKPALLVHFATLPEPRRAAARITHPTRWRVSAEGTPARRSSHRASQSRLPSAIVSISSQPSAPQSMPTRTTPTIVSVFRLLRPDAFGACLATWMRTLVGDLHDRVVAIDGKTLRGVGTHSERTLHLVHAWAAEARVLLGMTTTVGAPGELEATRELLGWLDVRGAILTTDANGCCRENMGLMVERGANWLCSLKGNRGAMYEAVARFFADIPVAADEADEVAGAASAEDAHGRLDVRHVAVASASAAGVTGAQLPASGRRSASRACGWWAGC